MTAFPIASSLFNLARPTTFKEIEKGGGGGGGGRSNLATDAHSARYYKQLFCHFMKPMSCRQGLNIPKIIMTLQLFSLFLHQRVNFEMESGIAQLYSINDAIETLGFGLFQWIATLCCGWIAFAAGLTVMVIAVLSPLVKCEWSLSSEEEALITTMVFLGYAAGNLFWGYFSDRFGRKKSLFCASALLLLSGVLGTLKLTPKDARNPGYLWMLVWRFVVGLGGPVFEQSLVYYIELLPLKFRGILSLILMSCFSVGTIAGPALAVVAVGFLSLNWHWFLGIACVPSALIFCSLPFIPESPRWHLAKGNLQKAEDVLKFIARWNCRKLPVGSLVKANSFKHEDNLKENCDESKRIDQSEKESVLTNKGKNKIFHSEKKCLLSSDNPFNESNSIEHTVLKEVHYLKLILVGKMRKTFILLGIMWIGVAWIYIGCILLSTSMLISYPHCSLHCPISQVLAIIQEEMIKHWSLIQQMLFVLRPN